MIRDFLRPISILGKNINRISNLENRFIFSNSLMLIKAAVHVLTNLKFGHNWQLLCIGSIVEESVGSNYHAIKLYAKTIPKFEHCV